MNISVILGHPKKGSFCHAIAETVVQTLTANGHEPRFHDLYAEGFDPLLRHEEMPKDALLDPEIRKHCGEIAVADGIVVIHPNWWGQPPAILKGWIDRIIRPGFAYEFVAGDGGEGVPRGLLKAKAAIVFNTSNTGREREQDVFGDPLETIWKNCVFGLCGVTNVYRRTFSIVVTSTGELRKQWLEEARAETTRIFPKCT
jgi:putative NADPH-quinone reductase